MQSIIQLTASLHKACEIVNGHDTDEKFAEEYFNKVYMPNEKALIETLEDMRKHRDRLGDDEVITIDDLLLDEFVVDDDLKEKLLQFRQALRY